MATEKKRGELRIGTSGYLYTHWRGSFYPEALDESKWLAFYVDEAGQRMDFNQDGDTDDAVLYLRDLESGETTNLGFSLTDTSRWQFDLSGKWLTFEIDESDRENSESDQNPPRKRRFFFLVRAAGPGALLWTG